MLTNPTILVLGTIFLWWAATGFILLAVRMADRSPAWGSHLGLAVISSPLLALGSYGLHISAATLTLESVLIGFLSALAIWGWIELAFLTGTITGPNKSPAKDQTGWARLSAAIGSIYIRNCC